MKKLFVALLISLTMMVSTAVAKDLIFTWDANTEIKMAGYALYERVEGQNYNYDTPIVVKDCTIMDGGCYVNVPEKTNDVDYPLDGVDGAITTYYFVARAHDTDELYSGDSDEISFIYDLAPIVAATNFTGVYNSVTQTVDFAWAHADTARVTKWGLFKSDVSGSGYVEVASIENTPPVLSTSYELPYEPGTTSYYVLVAYTAENKFSSDSNELRIKLGPQKVLNLKVRIKNM